MCYFQIFCRYDYWKYTENLNLIRQDITGGDNFDEIRIGNFLVGKKQLYWIGKNSFNVESLFFII